MTNVAKIVISFMTVTTVLYLLLYYRQGTGTLLNGTTSLITGVQRTAQGR